MRAARLRDRAVVALLGALAVAPAARGQDLRAPAAGGSLRLSAEPPRLVLGRDGSAELHVTAGPDVEDVMLSASAGRVESLRRVPGGFAARYRAPADRIPQIAIVAALGRTPHGTEHGWLAIPLSGQGDARVRTRPGEEITLQIGDRTFGPRRAGEDGVAVIPVVVPPGVQEAHQGFRPIDLHVPETTLLHAVLDRGTVFADRPEKLRVLAYVVAPHGVARRGDVPTFEASRGTISVAERDPGTIEASWTLPPGRAGEERLSVRLQSSPASRAVLKVDAVAGPPAAVAVSFDREALVADARDPVTVTARALDAAGNPVPAAIVLSADGGRLEDVRPRDVGEVEARLRAGPAFAGRTEVRVTAAAEGIGISGGRVLPLRSGEPALARFDAGDGVLRTDPGVPALLRLSVADRHGNPVDAPPAVTAERGKVLAVSAAAPGAFEVSYLPPPAGFGTREKLVASVGGARAMAEPLLLGPAPPFAMEGGGSVLSDARGRFRGLALTAAVETPAAWTPVLERGLDAWWRAEGHALRLGGRAAAAFLAGGAISRLLGASLVLHAGATGGVLAAPDGSAAAARLAVGMVRGAGKLAPFLEGWMLAASGGAPGGFAAVGISAGVRIPVERGHGDHPHRR